MNPYQSRRLANRIHKDRARRIETLLVRLAANGDLEPAPRHGLHKVFTPHYVWCDVHCAVHSAVADYFQDNPDCKDENWRSIFVASTDPNEEF
jgi:hypothetical protein